MSELYPVELFRGILYSNEFAGYITNPIDVYTFVADYNPHMEIGDVANIVADLQKHGKL